MLGPMLELDLLAPLQMDLHSGSPNLKTHKAEITNHRINHHRVHSFL